MIRLIEPPLDSPVCQFDFERDLADRVVVAVATIPPGQAIRIRQGGKRRHGRVAQVCAEGDMGADESGRHHWIKAWRAACRIVRATAAGLASAPFAACDAAGDRLRVESVSSRREEVETGQWESGKIARKPARLLGNQGLEKNLDFWTN
ncbi:MAG: hypothetical protein LBK55_06260 [Azoarcus sp.]|nr:hypothetical protein [Azoarcus sp.]